MQSVSRLCSCVLAVLLLLHVAQAHYVFNKLKIDGIELREFEGIRRNDNFAEPLRDMHHPDLRCNSGGAVSNGTRTVGVEAGRNVTWMVDSYVYHQGPVSVFMSKVADAAEADGSAPWFKILDIGPRFAKTGGIWMDVRQPEFNITIPPCIPPGDYLLRIQHIAVHLPGKPPQFHVACAQLHVTGAGSTLPPVDKTVRIPGLFERDHPGFTQNIFVDFRSYEIPGGEVWRC